MAPALATKTTTKTTTTTTTTTRVITASITTTTTGSTTTNSTSTTAIAAQTLQPSPVAPPPTNPTETVTTTATIPVLIPGFSTTGTVLLINPLIGSQSGVTIAEAASSTFNNSNSNSNNNVDNGSMSNGPLTINLSIVVAVSVSLIAIFVIILVTFICVCRRSSKTSIFSLGPTSSAKSSPHMSLTTPAGYNTDEQELESIHGGSHNATASPEINKPFPAASLLHPSTSTSSWLPRFNWSRSPQPGRMIMVEDATETQSEVSVVTASSTEDRRIRSISTWQEGVAGTDRSGGTSAAQVVRGMTTTVPRGFGAVREVEIATNTEDRTAVEEDSSEMMRTDVSVTHTGVSASAVDIPFRSMSLIQT